MDIVTRIKNYCMKEEGRNLASHVTGYKEASQEVEFTYGDKKVYVNIDDLEKGYFDENTLTVNKPSEISPNQAIPDQTVSMENNTPIMPEVKEEPAPVIEEQPAPVVESAPNTTNITLNDIKTLVELKNKETLDTILKQVAMTPTGEVDINSIIGTVANNLINETITATNENRILSTELYKYDKVGKLITKEEPSTTPVDVVVNENNGFSNLMVYIEAAKLYNVEYSNEQIQTAKENFVNSVNSKTNAAPINNEPVQQEGPVNEEVNTKVLKPTPMPVESEKAGFADVFILAMIVLVYAAIIVNLIIKIR